jgi:hypothetical protein
MGYKVILLISRRFLVMLKVELSLCLIKHHVIKAYAGLEVRLHAFLTS